MELSEEQLVTASRGGDRKAYAGLVRRHLRRVFAVCLGLLGDPDEAEDLTQETFLKGLARLPDLRDDERFEAWIVRIAQNLCRDHRRAGDRRRRLLEVGSAELITPPDAPSSAFDDLHTALERLEPEHRLPLMLYYFDGHSAAGVARVLEISEAGAFTRLSRARRALRCLLEAGTGGS